MSDLCSSEPATQASGSRLVPPSLPPAPPSGGQRPPSPGQSSPGPGGSGSSTLEHHFTECLDDLALIRTSLEMLTAFSGSQDVELEAEMRPLIEDARLRLIQRLQEIDCQVTDGSGSLTDVELQGFHRAMVDVMRRGMPWTTIEHYDGVRGRAGAFGPRSVFRYDLPLRHRHDDPSSYSPSTLLRRILEDLIDELSTDANLTGEEQFTRFVFQKFGGVLFACLVGATPIQRDVD